MVKETDGPTVWSGGPRNKDDPEEQNNHWQGGHGTGNLAVNFPRQGKHREFIKFNFLHRENCGNMENFENLEFFDNFVIKVATM